MKAEELRQKYKDEMNRTHDDFSPHYTKWLESLICDPWTKVKNGMPEEKEDKNHSDLVIMETSDEELYLCRLYEGHTWIDDYTYTDIVQEAGKIPVRWMKIPE